VRTPGVGTPWTTAGDTMPKVDLKKELKELYLPSHREVVTVDVPPMDFLMVDGEGNPNDSEEFQDACEALYGMAYTIKFMLKKAKTGDEFVVPPLEGLWWADDMDAFLDGKKDSWKWTLMIMQPEWVTEAHVDDARAELARKKDPAALPRLRFETYGEGLSAQIMHIGPYSEERPTIARLHGYIHDGGHERRGRHHEIYIGDPRRTRPDKLRTVIRQPFQ